MQKFIKLHQVTKRMNYECMLDIYRKDGSEELLKPESIWRCNSNGEIFPGLYTSHKFRIQLVHFLLLLQQKNQICTHNVTAF